MAFNDFIQTELPKRPFTADDGSAGQVMVRSSNPLAAREMVFVEADTLATRQTLQLIAEGDIGGHRVVRAVFPSSARYASNTTLSDAPNVVGLTLGAVSSGTITKVVTSGGIIEPSWAWVEGLPIFVGVLGNLTQIPPTTGFQLIVGVATSPTSIFVSIRQPIIL